MKLYPEYKDSGVEWIGKIPREWSLKRFKHLLKRNKGAIKTGPFGSQLKGQDFVESGIKVYTQRTVLDKNFDNGAHFITKDKYKSLQGFEVFPNDILITSRGTIGKCVIVPEDAEMGVLHPCLIRLQANPSVVYNEYLRLFIQESSLFKESVLYESDATTIEVIYSDTLKNVKIPLPTFSDQKQIIDYLDHKTHLIDTLIEKKKKQIELLQEQRAAIINQAVTKGLNPDVKMKDSGIEWLGEVPEHWKVCPIKRIVKEHKQGFYTQEEYADEGIKLLRITDIDDFSNVDFSYCPFVSINQKDLNGFYLVPDDFVFARSGTIGRFGIIRKSVSAVFASYLIRFRFLENVYTEYLKFFFLSDYFKKMLISDLHGGANQNVHAENIKNQNISFPNTINEQHEIACFLNTQTNQIELQISCIEKTIDLLKEYRTTLISEVVTGKIDVRDEAIP